MKPSHENSDGEPLLQDGNPPLLLAVVSINYSPSEPPEGTDRAHGYLLNEFQSTALAGNDIASSVLYAAGGAKPSPYLTPNSNPYRNPYPKELRSKRGATWPRHVWSLSRLCCTSTKAFT